jgi:hypothetical protein
MVVEVPRYCCEEGRHQWKIVGEVLIRKSFLWWNWVAEKDKWVCCLCNKVEYFSPYDGL